MKNQIQFMFTKVFDVYKNSSKLFSLQSNFKKTSHEPNTLAIQMSFQSWMNINLRLYTYKNTINYIAMKTIHFGCKVIKFELKLLK